MVFGFDLGTKSALMQIFKQRSCGPVCVKCMPAIRKYKEVVKHLRKQKSSHDCVDSSVENLFVGLLGLREREECLCQ